MIVANSGSRVIGGDDKGFLPSKCGEVENFRLLLFS